MARKIIILVLFMLITSVIRAIVDGILGTEMSGPLAYRVISQTVTMLTGAGILYILLEK